MAGTRPSVDYLGDEYLVILSILFSLRSMRRRESVPKNRRWVVRFLYAGGYCTLVKLLCNILIVFLSSAIIDNHS